MAHYQPLIHLSVSHPWFTDGRARGLQFEFCQRSQQWLRQYDLIQRPLVDGWLLLVDRERDDLDEMAEDLGQLLLRGHSQDPWFSNYTRWPGPAALAQYWYYRLPVEGKPPPELCTLTSDDPPKPGELHARFESPWQNRTGQFLLELMLCAADLQQAVQQGTPVHYQLALEVVAPYWQYSFLAGAAIARAGMQITDASGKNCFTPLKEDRLQDGTAVISATSLAPIPFSQHYRAPCRLVDPVNGQTLIRALPGADHRQQLWRGDSGYLAQILINYF